MRIDPVWYDDLPVEANLARITYLCHVSSCKECISDEECRIVDELYDMYRFTTVRQVIV
jgi:hypothetical protein